MSMTADLKVLPKEPVTKDQIMKARGPRMRIAYIGSRGFPGFSAGVEKSLEEICPRLALRGHEVTLYCSQDVATSDKIYRGTVLKRMPAISTKHLETISRTAFSGCDAVFRNYDVVHFHSLGPALISWMTRLAGLKTVVTVHGLDWQRAKWGALAKFSLKVGELTSVLFPHRTIVISRPLQRYYQESHGRDVTCIPNGVTVKPYRPVRFIKQKWGLEQGEYILFASRLVPEKEAHTLIKAFRQLKTKKKLVIAGASWHSDDYVRRLNELASGCPDIIFTGWAEGEVLEELFSNAYLYCLPSQIEGLSLSLLEAMSYGICPLISDIPENTDVVGEQGVIFETGSVDDLKEKLIQLLIDEDRVRRLGGLARQAVEHEYSWDKHTDLLEQAYWNVIGSGNAQRPL